MCVFCHECPSFFHLLHYTWQDSARCTLLFSNLVWGPCLHLPEVLHVEEPQVREQKVDMFVCCLEFMLSFIVFIIFLYTAVTMRELQLVFLNMRCFNACRAWIPPEELLTFFFPCFPCSFFLSFFIGVQLLPVLDTGTAKKWNWQSYFNIQNVTQSLLGLCAADGGAK